MMNATILPVINRNPNIRRVNSKYNLKYKKPRHKGTQGNKGGNLPSLKWLLIIPMIFCLVPVILIGGLIIKDRKEHPVKLMDCVESGDYKDCYMMKEKEVVIAINIHSKNQDNIIACNNTWVKKGREELDLDIFFYSNAKFLKKNVLEIDERYLLGDNNLNIQIFDSPLHSKPTENSYNINTFFNMIYYLLDTYSDHKWFVLTSDDTYIHTKILFSELFCKFDEKKTQNQYIYNWNENQFITNNPQSSSKPSSSINNDSETYFYILTKSTLQILLERFDSGVCNLEYDNDNVDELVHSCLDIDEINNIYHPLIYPQNYPKWNPHKINLPFQNHLWNNPFISLHHVDTSTMYELHQSCFDHCDTL